jgi:hypothetical protein
MNVVIVGAGGANEALVKLLEGEGILIIMVKVDEYRPKKDINLYCGHPHINAHGYTGEYAINKPIPTKSPKQGKYKHLEKISKKRT